MSLAAPSIALERVASDRAASETSGGRHERQIARPYNAAMKRLAWTSLKLIGSLLGLVAKFGFPEADIDIGLYALLGMGAMMGGQGGMPPGGGAPPGGLPPGFRR